MGIYRFSSRMQGYASQVSLDSTQPVPHSFAIIDGPSLAYHIWGAHCAVHQASTCWSLQDYALIAASTIAWLDKMQGIGFTIDAILFDGGLPHFKIKERMKRLQATTGNLQMCRRTYSSIRANSTMPPPFFITAIIEALRASSTYASVTFQVPGEADGFCVAAARDAYDNHGTDVITVFSDDTDLLVYPATDRTRVMTFRDLNMIETQSSFVLTGIEYWPTQLARKCLDPSEGLLHPAYFMSVNPQCTFEQAVKMQVDCEPMQVNEFMRFKEAYNIALQSKDWIRIKSDTTSSNTMHLLDTRLSELLLQLKDCLNPNAQLNLDSFLLFLIDDPNRSSAWTIATELRTLAYTMLLKCHGQTATINEHTRTGQPSGIRTQEIKMMDETQMIGLLTQLSLLVRQSGTAEMQISSVTLPQYIVISYLCQQSWKLGRPSPKLHNFEEIISGIGRRSDWQTRHLSAQYEAVFYSFRMLSQVVRYSMTAVDSAFAHELLSELSSGLNGFLDIATFFQSPSSAQISSRRVLVENLLVRQTFKLANRKEQKFRAKKGKASESRQKKGTKKSMSSNPFALLAD